MYICRKVIQIYQEASIYYRLLLLSSLRSLLGCLLLPLDDSFSANTAKDKTHAQPLTCGEGVAEPEHTQEHGQHLARDCHRDQEQG